MVRITDRPDMTSAVYKFTVLCKARNQTNKQINVRNKSKIKGIYNNSTLLHEIVFALKSFPTDNIYICQCLPFNELLFSNCLHQTIKTLAHVTKVV